MLSGFVEGDVLSLIIEIEDDGCQLRYVSVNEDNEDFTCQCIEICTCAFICSLCISHWICSGVYP